MGGKAHPGPLWPALGWKDRGARPRDKQRGPRGPRLSQAARPYLSPGAPRSSHTQPFTGVSCRFGRGKIMGAYFTNKETEAQEGPETWWKLNV